MHICVAVWLTKNVSGQICYVCLRRLNRSSDALRRALSVGSCSQVALGKQDVLLGAFSSAVRHGQRFGVLAFL